MFIALGETAWSEQSPEKCSLLEGNPWLWRAQSPGAQGIMRRLGPTSAKVL
jgi:hypothetical protein